LKTISKNIKSHAIINFISPMLPSLSCIIITVCFELLGYCFSYLFISVPCARLSRPSRQLLSAHIVSYRNNIITITAIH